VYYLNRSQPPFLTQMVNAYYSHTRDLVFLKMVRDIVERNLQVKHDPSPFFTNKGTPPVDQRIRILDGHEGGRSLFRPIQVPLMSFALL
jgi:hypothetical protein